MAAKKILIIEDEAPLRKALEEKFSFLDVDILIAKNGADGLEISLKEHPDIILLDLIMPVMDGITMLRKLREDEWGKNVDVIVLTNLSDPKELEEAKKLGALDHFIKSDFRIEEVFNKVSKKLNLL